MLATIVNSNRKDKKYTAIIVSDSKVKTIHFGASGYEDFTTHGDDIRKDKYIKRHQKREDWNDPFKPGFWAKNLLWNKPTLEESAADIEAQHAIKVTLYL
jgi:hypothetical protein